MGKSCQKIYREGQYCRVCDRVWLPTSKDMVCCDKCSLWVHGECDPAAREALSGPEDAPYFCPTCRPKVLDMYNEKKPNQINAPKLFMKETGIKCTNTKLKKIKQFKCEFRQLNCFVYPIKETCFSTLYTLVIR